MMFKLYSVAYSLRLSDKINTSQLSCFAAHLRCLWIYFLKRSVFVLVMLLNISATVSQYMRHDSLMLSTYIDPSVYFQKFCFLCQLCLCHVFLRPHSHKSPLVHNRFDWLVWVTLSVSDLCINWISWSCSL